MVISIEKRKETIQEKKGLFLERDLFLKKGALFFERAEFTKGK